MPRAFQDAIDITRQLGIRYLWIDSLCIIQGFEGDWEEQSSIMGDIYAHSFCTLAVQALAVVMEDVAQLIRNRHSPRKLGLVI
jgi:hypothetical protein